MADQTTITEALAKARQTPGRPVTLLSDEDRAALERHADRLRAQAERLSAQARQEVGE